MFESLFGFLSRMFSPLFPAKTFGRMRKSSQSFRRTAGWIIVGVIAGVVLTVCLRDMGLPLEIEVWLTKIGAYVLLTAPVVFMLSFFQPSEPKRKRELPDWEQPRDGNASASRPYKPLK